MSYLSAILFSVIISVSCIFPISASGHLSALSLFFGKTIPDGCVYLFLAFSYLGIAFGQFYRERAVLFRLISLRRHSRAEAHRSSGDFALRSLIFVLISAVISFPVVFFSSFTNMLSCSAVWIGFASLISASFLLYGTANQNGGRSERNITIQDALIVGLMGLFAAIPGLSHVGLMISACYLLDFKREYADKYVFILTAVLLLFANLFLLYKAIASGFDWSYFPLCLIAIPSSFAGSYFSRLLFDRFSAKHGLAIFGYYGIVVGASAVILSLIH